MTKASFGQTGPTWYDSSRLPVVIRSITEAMPSQDAGVRLVWMPQTWLR